MISKKIAHVGVQGQFDLDDLGWILTALPAIISEEQKALCNIELSGLWKASSNATEHELRVCAASYARSRETEQKPQVPVDRPSMPPLTDAKRAKLAKLLGTRQMSVEPREAVFKTVAAETQVSENSEFKNQALYSAALTMGASL